MCLDIPSESFGEALEILDRRSWPPCVGSGPLVGAPCSSSRGTGLPVSPDQGGLFLLLRLGWQGKSFGGRPAGRGRRALSCRIIEQLVSAPDRLEKILGLTFYAW